MIGLIGKKVGMTQVFGEKGDVIPVTVIQAGPCVVAEVRTPERDGYSAVQLGFGDAGKTRNRSRGPRRKPVLGQFAKRNLPAAASLHEFRVTDASGYQVGQTLNVDLFEAGTRVDVQGVTKGRGFTGVVKRYGFVAGHASHGPTHGKQPGSIGASAYPSRVVKGKRLPGRMGGVRFTTKNVQVVAIDAEQHYILIKGAVPGPTNGLVFVHKREEPR